MHYGQLVHAITYISNFFLVQDIFIDFLFEPIQNIPISLPGHRDVCRLKTDKIWQFVKILMPTSTYDTPGFPLFLLPELLTLLLNFIGKKNCNVQF
jgi:hypothetical protein